MLDIDAARLERHSVTIAGHSTSLSIERGFWLEFKRLAQRESVSIAELVRQLDEARAGSLSGAIRSYVLQEVLAETKAGQGPSSSGSLA